MLVRFSVGNYKSFKNIVEFKMGAGKIKRLDSHLISTVDGKRILKGGFIFGANASGKSNLVSVVDKDYLIGRYGAVPIFDRVAQHESGDGE